MASLPFARVKVFSAAAACRYWGAFRSRSQRLFVRCWCSPAECSQIEGGCDLKPCAWSAGAVAIRRVRPQGGQVPRKKARLLPLLFAASRVLTGKWEIPFGLAPHRHAWRALQDCPFALSDSADELVFHSEHQ